MLCTYSATPCRFTVKGCTAEGIVEAVTEMPDPRFNTSLSRVDGRFGWLLSCRVGMRQQVVENPRCMEGVWPPLVMMRTASQSQLSNNSDGCRVRGTCREEVWLRGPDTSYRIDNYSQ
jgi:hypothetical protein